MAQSNYSTAVLADSPVAFYKLNEASGLPQDSSGNTYHMTASSGTASYQYDSPFSGAQGIRFNSGATTINLSRALFSTATNNITFEVWIKILSVPSSGRSFIDAGTTSGGWLISFFDSPEEYLDFSHVSRTTYPGPRIVRMGWRQYVIVRRSGTYEIYVDGDFWPSGGNTAMDAPVGSFAIGGVYLDLVLSNISYYETALSATRIKAHYDAAMDRPQPPTNTYAQEVMVDTPVAFYKLDEASGLPQDSSGNAYHMTTSAGDAPTYREAGPFSGSYAYGIHLPSVTSSFSRTSYFSSFDVDFSIELWIKGNHPKGTRFCRNGEGVRNIDLDADISTKQLRGFAGVTGQDYGPEVVDTWRMFTLTFKESTPVWKYYWDGELYDGNAGTTVPGNTASGAFYLTYATNSLADFSISNISMYTTELSAARIKAHYNAAMRYIPSYQRVSQGAILNG